MVPNEIVNVGPEGRVCHKVHTRTHFQCLVEVSYRTPSANCSVFEWRLSRELWGPAFGWLSRHRTRPHRELSGNWKTTNGNHRSVKILQSLKCSPWFMQSRKQMDMQRVLWNSYFISHVHTWPPSNRCIICARSLERDYYSLITCINSLEYLLFKRVSATAYQHAYQSNIISILTKALTIINRAPHSHGLILCHH